MLRSCRAGHGRPAGASLGGVARCCSPRAVWFRHYGIPGGQGLGRGSGREVVVEEEMPRGSPHGAGPRLGPERAQNVSDGVSSLTCLCRDPPGTDKSCVGDPAWATGHVSSTLPPPQDAASFRAEPEPVYSMEVASYQEASSQQGPAYASDAVYEATEAPGHYQAGTGTGAPHRVPCLHSSAEGVPVSPLPGPPHPACAGGVLVSLGGRVPDPLPWGSAGAPAGVPGRPGCSGVVGSRSVKDGASAVPSRWALGAEPGSGIREHLEVLKDDFCKL